MSDYDNFTQFLHTIAVTKKLTGDTVPTSFKELRNKLLVMSVDEDSSVDVKTQAISLLRGMDEYDRILRPVLKNTTLPFWEQT